ncbi:MAG: GNAT family N-acetyltransferase [Candidatus Kariarchaeaceae archaeon]|jgi:RimJ/RimL family protein N-acetyltransferase
MDTSPENLFSPVLLETDRLQLRPYSKGDGKAFYEMLDNNNRMHLHELLGSIAESTDVSQLVEWIASLRQDWDTKRRFVLSIWDKETGVFYGHIWIEPIHREIPHFEIGWFVDMNHQGKGIITEAAKRAIRFIFEDLDGKNIRVRVRDHGPYKDKSINIAKRCNFTKEGFLRDTVKLENGKIIGEHYFSIIQSEFTGA